ncbi:MAG: CPBP family glutamic-type intramembrane protease, partial [Nevskiales bacterium]
VWNDVEIFKLIFWLFIPLAFCWKNFDRGWYGVARWRTTDVILLVTLAGLGALVLMMIPLVPELREGYTGIGELSPAVKREFVIGIMIWNLTWLPGWEFLMRYVLLRTAMERWPRFGWWLVPLAEGLYHLQKTMPEMLASVAFSVVLTYWAFARRNGLLPLVAHAVVEIELVVLMLMW